MAAPSESQDPAMERAQLADRLMLHLQGSIEAFQRDVLASIQTEFWSAYIREQGATLDTMDRIFAHQSQLVTDICAQMHEVVTRECSPLARMVTERVPAWARALQVEADRVIETPQVEAIVQTLTPVVAVEEPEKTLTPVEPGPALHAPRPGEQLSWRMQWRERHGITVPSRRTSQRRSTSQTRTQEQTRGQGYGE